MTYDTRTGQLAVWRGGTYLGSWTDPTPLTSGGYISLRTDSANVSFDSLIVLRVVKYYYSGGQRIALRRDGIVSYLLTDHLGSTRVTTDAAGAQAAEMKYYPFGATRYNSGGQKTTYRFTGQRFGPGGGGLYDYGARWYDSTIGRFIQADSIVPNLANPQSLNRYSYVRNNPLRLVDPSGMAECAAGDTACWQNEWEWKNRWYEAHGWFAEGNGWTRRGDPKMQDAGIARDVLGEADIHLSGTGRWTADSIMQMAYGVSLFASRLAGGMNQLRHLLGVKGLWSITVVDKTCAGSACAPPMLGVVWFPSSWAVDQTATTFVHELAHVIDWTSSFFTLNGFSAHWGYAPLTDYAAGIPPQPYPVSWDRWAEAATVWVFGGIVNTTGSFETSFKTTQVHSYVGQNDLNVQMNRMTELLNGWR